MERQYSSRLTTRCTNTIVVEQRRQFRVSFSFSHTLRLPQHQKVVSDTLGLRYIYMMSLGASPHPLALVAHTSASSAPCIGAVIKQFQNQVRALLPLLFLEHDIRLFASSRSPHKRLASYGFENRWTHTQ
eukprot:4818791-Karenia_brevis.AAC.1